MIARSLVLVSLFVGASLLAGCGAQGVTPPQDTQGRYVIHMLSNLTFDPVEAMVPRGATVTWLNVGNVTHDVSGYEGDPPKTDRPGFFSSDENGLTRFLHRGDSFEHTFNETGTYTIWCHTHHEERMKGLVHVT